VECTAALGELGGRILVLLAKSLELDPNQFKRHLRSASRTTLRMNHYPPCPHPDKIEGLYAHSDASMISIVHQGLVGGLQILKDDKWVGVRPNPASLVVNIGEAVMVSLKFSLPFSKFSSLLLLLCSTFTLLIWFEKLASSPNKAAGFLSLACFSTSIFVSNKILDAEEFLSLSLSLSLMSCTHFKIY
jgi:hypothetical protein